MFEVDGLDEHGRHKRSLFTRAAFKAGALPLRINAALTWGDEPADQRNRPTAVVTARSADSIAVGLCATDQDRPPGEDPGVLVATPKRLALLEVAENPDADSGWLDQIKKYTGPVYRLANDFASTMHSTVNYKGRDFDHGGQTRTPAVAEKASIPIEQIAGYDVVRREFRWLGHEKHDREGTYLRITFTDHSHLDLHLAGNPDADRALQMTRDGSGSPCPGPPGFGHPLVTEHSWLAPGEHFQRIFPYRPGLFGATIAGRTVLPHQPLTPVPSCAPRDEDFGHPSDLVVAGRYRGDEWVHDHSLRGWLDATTSDQCAVAVTDNITATNGYGWLVVTNRRIAVVIAPDYTTPGPVPKPLRERGIRHPEPNLDTLWEAPVGVLRGIRDERHGRTLTGSPFAQLDFSDGSSLLIRQ
ncbi:hypothetical protein [Saccharopolyspora cebuensis]|uniref:Uncharacterized protein n=1 Tax=Saccharopolyspora cebuensis TaxID=418759 RepID=A0ABV4CFY2_9PSEU